VSIAHDEPYRATMIQLKFVLLTAKGLSLNNRIGGLGIGL
jgi:hypothetical protein